MIDIRRIGADESISINCVVDINIPRGFGVGDAAKVALAGVLTNQGNSFVLDCQGNCRVFTACSCCLVPVELEISFRVNENYVEDRAIDACDISFSDKMIDLTPAVERGAFNNLPMKPLCSPDCLGLCVKCGANQNQMECGCGGEVNEQFSELLRMFEKEV